MKYFRSIVVSSVFFFLSFIFLLHFFTPTTFAATESNCVEIQKGNPANTATGGCGGASNDPIYQAAKLIVDGVTANPACKTLKSPPSKSVFASDVGAGCLDNLPSVGAEPVRLMKQSATEISSFLQCIAFVVASTTQANMAFAGPHYTNAVDYVGNAPPGYKWVAKSAATLPSMQPGNVAIWDGSGIEGINGHIAIVSAPAQGVYFKVLEANGDGEGVVREMRYTTDMPDFKGWFVKQ